MRISGIMVLAIMLLVSCRSTRQIQTAISKIDTAAVQRSPLPVNADSLSLIRAIYRDIMDNRIDYHTFSGKVDVDYEDGEGKKYNVNVHIRMRKDSLIWVMINGPLGIEGLRALITEDSVKMLDKQNKAYIARSVGFLQEMTALPLDLRSLQDLIIGNPVFFDSTITSFNRNEQTISMQVLNHFFKHLIAVSTSDRRLLSSKLDDSDESRQRTCLLTYEDYENRKGVKFSTKRKINVAEKKKLDLRLDFKQYEFNETLSFPFNIPKNYDHS